MCGLCSRLLYNQRSIRFDCAPSWVFRLSIPGLIVRLKQKENSNEFWSQKFELFLNRTILSEANIIKWYKNYSSTIASLFFCILGVATFS